jgi:hypothetical protein
LVINNIKDHESHHKIVENIQVLFRHHSTRPSRPKEVQDAVDAIMIATPLNIMQPLMTSYLAVAKTSTFFQKNKDLCTTVDTRAGIIPVQS